MIGTIVYQLTRNLSPAEIKQKIKDGEIVDAKTVCAFLRYLSDI